jgi:predicted O-linked N-acetylglucosamine transferase (SPINDLY family)
MQVNFSGNLLEEAKRLQRDGDHGRAAGLCRSIIQADPQNFEAFYLLGFLHGQSHEFEEAQYFFGEASMRNPASAEPFFMRGYALQQLARDEEAISSFGRALAINPYLAEALLNRAASLFRLRRYEEAAGDYETLLTFEPDFPFVRGNLLFSRLHCCAWRGFEEQQAAIKAGIAAGKRVIAPFDSKALDLSAEEELVCAKLWVADQYPAPPRSPRKGSQTHRRIRLAYVSGDFHAHALATLMVGVFENHDRTRFETIALSLGPDDGSPLRARLNRAFDRFIDVRGKSDAEIAEIMQEIETDIAVDLMGFTEGCRPGIFAHRPASVQANYLGYPGTMGADFMDYLIADEIVAPMRQHRHYTESVVTLPDSFMPADSARPIGSRVFTRAEMGLPANGFVFCCFNASYKITPPMFDSWMRLLENVEGSVLWLGQANGSAQRNLRLEAEVRGIAGNRLVFAPYLPSAADHLARLKLADLFLDTLPYNAHATAADALWAGLPVLTCMGERFAGRVAASLLRAVGLAELITDSLDGYEAKARELARDPAALDAIKATLQRNRATHSLFDTAGFTRNLEKAYVTMWERRLRGLPPQSFAVSEAGGDQPA